MLFHESLEVTHMCNVVHIGVEFEGRLQQIFVSETGVHRVLLILHIVVTKSGKFSTFPGEVSNEQAVVKGTENEQAVASDSPLV